MRRAMRECRKRADFDRWTRRAASCPRAFSLVSEGVRSSAPFVIVVVHTDEGQKWTQTDSLSVFHSYDRIGQCRTKYLGVVEKTHHPPKQLETTRKTR